MSLGDEIAVIDYVLKDSVMTITHTEVPPQLNGRGLAGELMHEALATAKAAGWTVIPACSYAAFYIRRRALREAESRKL